MIVSRSHVSKVFRSGFLLAVMAAAMQSPAHAQSDAGVSVQRMQEELARRDAVIAELVERIRALEAGGNAAALPPVAAAQTMTDAGPAPQESGGGDFEVDRLAAARALERSLVQEGLSLLAPGQVEFTPALGFSRIESDFPALIQAGGTMLIGTVDQRLNIAESGMNLRIGLPLDAQFEFGLQYRTVHLQERTLAGGTATSSNGRTSSGFGDIGMGLAKAIFAQEGARPRLMGRLTWLTGSGKEFGNGLFLGGGTSALAGQLSASWRSDPVVFFVTGAYTRYLSNDVLGRKDGLASSLGLSVAISPETALLFALDQSYTSAIRAGGVRLGGTDLLSSLLTISSSTIVGRQYLLRADVGIGLTNDAPDYRIGLALPMRW
jgi:hypothetical protein